MCQSQQTCTEIISAPEVGGDVISGYAKDSVFRHNQLCL